MKNRLLTYFAIGSLAFGTLGYAQGDGMGPGGPGGPEIRPDLPEDVAALRDEVKTMRDDLATSRDAAIASLGDEATREERATALASWREQNQTEIDAIKAKTEDLKGELRGLGGKREPVPVPDEIAEARAEMQELAKSLAESRRAAVAELGDDASVEDKQAAVASWRDDNAADIAILDGLREEVSTWMQENRPNRGARIGVGQAVRDRIQNFKEDAEAMKVARERLRNQLAQADTEEAKKDLIRQFREQYRSLMQERRQLKRLERLAGSGNGGDRRPGG